MPKIIVDVMFKPEIRDPQGEAIAGACHRLGFTEVVSVRQGKRFEIEVADGAQAGANDGADGVEAADDVDRAAGADGPGATHGGGRPATRVAELAAELLANPIIEEFVIRGA